MLWMKQITVELMKIGKMLGDPSENSSHIWPDTRYLTMISCMVTMRETIGDKGCIVFILIELRT